MDIKRFSLELNLFRKKILDAIEEHKMKNQDVVLPIPGWLQAQLQRD